VSKAQRNRRLAHTQAAPQVFVLAARPAQPPAVSLPSEDQIRLLAYQKWEAAGRPTGDGVDFWCAAERELMAS
jgi:hypothetical protein